MGNQVEALLQFFRVDETKLSPISLKISNYIGYHHSHVTVAKEPGIPDHQITTITLDDTYIRS